MHKLPFSKEAIDRFWSKVKKTEECWPWLGKPDAYGYGRLRIGGRKTIKAHRMAWALEHGEMPPDDILVCHTCDNTLCVRGKHLFLGTIIENVSDMDRKGRRTIERGEDRDNAKLTDKTVRIIVSLCENGGMRQRDIAAKFGIHQVLVSRIASGKAWKHIKRHKVVSDLSKSRKKWAARKLSAENVETIRVLYARGGIAQQKLADQFSVSQVRIGQIVRAKI